MCKILNSGDTIIPNHEVEKSSPTKACEQLGENNFSKYSFENPARICCNAGLSDAWQYALAQ